MISMTGYSKKDFKIQGISFSLSIKSLNSSKGCDITIKTPRYLIEIEPEIRKMIKKELIRGKVNFLITEDNNRLNLILNKKKLSSYIKTIREIEPKADSGAILNAAIKLPDIFVPDNLVVNKTTKMSILKIISKEINNLNIVRKKEGKILKKEIKLYLNNIIKISKELIPLELKRFKNRKLKIQNQFSKSDIGYDLSKLESEMIYYFERSDITEERVRLQYHCDFFNQVMNTEDFLGKKLNFISQEILREINTIGSKANDFEIQKRVVKMKEEIEKIKEQVQNIV
tara:strand:- start:1271 stop:2125 length:855 start_codon:yes stop_codon:yes gene_type:complete